MRLSIALLSYWPLLLVALGLFLIWLIWVSLYYVPSGRYLLIERRFILFPAPRQGHFIARYWWEQGVRAKAWNTGYHWIWFVKIRLFTITVLRNLVEVPAEHSAVVVALDGEPLHPGQLVAQEVVYDFLNGEHFLRAGGQRGIQIPMLPPGKYPINEALFRFVPQPDTKIGTELQMREMVIGSGERREVMVPKIGIVTLRTGKEIPESEQRTIGRVIPTPPGWRGHQNFQDIARFLDFKLWRSPVFWNKYAPEQGVQRQSLEPGAYRLNREIVDVEPVDAIFVPQGQVAVVIGNVGLEVTDKKGSPELFERAVKLPQDRPVSEDDEEYPGIFIIKKGYEQDVRSGLKPEIKGIKGETFGPGIIPFDYAHRYAYKVVPVDTTPISVCWADRDDHNSHQHELKDIKFEPIHVLTADGFTIPISAEIIANVKPDDAPKVVALAGSPRGLITDVVVPFVVDIIRAEFAKISLEELLLHPEVRKKAIKDRIEQEVEELSGYPIDVTTFRIRKFDFVNVAEEVKRFIDIVTQRATATQELQLIPRQTAVQRERRRLELARAEADLQRILVTANFRKLAAKDEQAAMALRAEGMQAVVKRLAKSPRLAQALGILTADPQILAALAEALGGLTRNFGTGEGGRRRPPAA